MAIPTSNLITYENIYSQSHANLFNLINARSNIPDPADSSGNRKFVYVRMPRIDSRNFEGFPFIVVPFYSIPQKRSSADASTANLLYNPTILIYTQDNFNSDSSGNPIGAEQLNQISNNVAKTLNANIKVLANYGMNFDEIPSSDFDYDEIEGKNTYQREFILSYSGRKKVIA